MRMGALAESGLSECTHDGTCGPSGSAILIFVALFLVGLLSLCAWVAFALIATASVLNAEPPVARRWLWLLLAWLVPFIVAGAW